MSFELLCMGVIALGFGLTVAFFGYKGGFYVALGRRLRW